MPSSETRWCLAFPLGLMKRALRLALETGRINDGPGTLGTVPHADKMTPAQYPMLGAPSAKAHRDGLEQIAIFLQLLDGSFDLLGENPAER